MRFEHIDVIIICTCVFNIAKKLDILTVYKIYIYDDEHANVIVDKYLCSKSERHI